MAHDGSREQVAENARRVKAKTYPRIDSSGRWLSESFCSFFVLINMAVLSDEGHGFLRLCKKTKNKDATMRLVDILATQHAN